MPACGGGAILLDPGDQDAMVAVHERIAVEVLQGLEPQSRVRPHDLAVALEPLDDVLHRRRRDAEAEPAAPDAQRVDADDAAPACRSGARRCCPD